MKRLVGDGAHGLLGSPAFQHRPGEHDLPGSSAVVAQPVLVERLDRDLCPVRHPQHGKLIGGQLLCQFGLAVQRRRFPGILRKAGQEFLFVKLCRRFCLHAGCGLYVLCACEGNDQLKMLKELFTLLGLSGIGGRTRFSRFYQDAFLSHFPQGHPVANIPDTPHLILGGGTGFFSKTVGYSYLKDDYAAALKWTQRILQTQHGRHEADISLGVSPHRARYITYAGKRYPAGFCEVNIL